MANWQEDLKIKAEQLNIKEETNEIKSVSENRSNSSRGNNSVSSSKDTSNTSNSVGSGSSSLFRGRVPEKTRELNKLAYWLGKKRPEHSEFMMRNNNPNFKHGLFIRENMNCCDCKKELSRPGLKRCRKCFFLWAKNPKNNPNWNGGIDKEGYSYCFSDTLKESIRKRDNHRCIICNKFGKDVHHIDYNKQNCNKSNLITLCKKCNIKVNYSRDYWYAYFRYVMENN